ncbi:MAG: hypothetical protein A2Y62_04340 [Candidatus Fischerbacteria bacterium RBG_13_37_8]|uniref:ABC transporter permease n=1 Tax=Candidatus Fischerbacteria bacterium RBG_13_37_8 TaxID=1817863 RepID=A0A1F5VFS7_9BACT|nr:MAG: hypothetical protein A2Y62_04340 [Candidatus Fischerbacteria bacterium RBG_13_37_8]
MNYLMGMKQVFSFFFHLNITSKKAKAFYLLSFLPVLALGIAKGVELLKPDMQVTAEQLFSRVLLITYVQLLIPILALLYGSLVIHEEVDNKTLVYLTSSPVPRPAILLGKYFACVALTTIIVEVSFFLCFLIININHFPQIIYFKEFITFFAIGALAIAVYTGFFTLLGSMLKKPLLLGLLFIFGWENVVQYFPGVTQKLTLIHFVKSLLPSTSENVKFLVFKLEPSGTIESLIVLLVLTIFFLIAASLIFKYKEYILADVM